VKQEDVLDESYRKAGKMDSERFSLRLDPFHTNLVKIIRDYLLEGTKSTTNIKAEQYKLNVYGTHLVFIILHLVLRCCPGKGSFFKPHVDTPRSENMFGSLVIVFPTPHEGGALHLRHRDHEWIFDSGKALSAEENPSIGFVAFFSDIEHEVTPVISGHRITLTYNLYFDDGGPVSANDATSEHLTPPPLPNEGAFREAFKALLENPEFLADGGTLAFGLRHVYPINRDLKHVYDVLKGSDAVVYQSFRALGYEPVLYLYYQGSSYGYPSQDMIIDKKIDFPNEINGDPDGQDLERFFLEEGAILASREGRKIKINPRFETQTPEQLEWVTPVTEFNRQKDGFPLYFGNDAGLIWVYGDVCLVVRIGKAGDRLGYPTLVEVNNAIKERLEDEARGRW
jgi:hypothetical protein